MLTALLISPSLNKPNLGFFIYGPFNSGAPAGEVARGAPWVRKYSNPSMRKILVMASGMVRRRAYSLRTSDQMTFLHEITCQLAV